MDTITVRLYKGATIKTLIDAHKNKTDGATKAVEAYAALRLHWQYHIKSGAGKIFQRKELAYLVDIQNATIFTAEVAASKSAWLASIEDADRLDGMGEKWEVDVAAMVAKIEQLSPFELYFWREEIDRFWSNPDAYGSPTPNLEKFLDDFTKGKL